MAAALVLGSSAVAVVLAEALLRLAVHPGDFMPAEMSPDPVLTHRVKPLTTLHDEFGFRNRAVPSQVDIVAIGDSFTYGNAAFRDQSWPARLGQVLGEPVYNMGMGGYGPLQYLHLARNQAKQLKPRLILLGLYLGNDILDAYYLAHTNAHWSGWRESATEGTLTDDRGVAAAPKPSLLEPVRRWLSRNSTLYWVIRGIRQRYSLQDEGHVVAPLPHVQWAWQDPDDASVRTVFTPEYRLRHVDLADPKVREGLSITGKALGAIRDEANAQHAKVLVVLMPSKEFAYCAHLAASRMAPPLTHAAVCKAESALRTEVLGLLSRHDLQVVDTLGAVHNAIAGRAALYPPSNDSHFSAPGYRLVADEVAGAIRAMRTPVQSR